MGKRCIAIKNVHEIPFIISSFIFFPVKIKAHFGHGWKMRLSIDFDLTLALALAYAQIPIELPDVKIKVCVYVLHCDLPNRNQING